MAQRSFSVLLSTAFLLCCVPASAQRSQAAPAFTAASVDTVHVTLGQSAVSLYGPWKFTVGDSPTDPRTGHPLWAEDTFDDSAWESVDLKSETGAEDPLSGITGYVPGWSVHGHPGYWGYAW